jgi:hypothetical protein
MFAVAIAILKNGIILGSSANICFPGFSNTEYTDNILVGEGREICLLHSIRKLADTSVS